MITVLSPLWSEKSVQLINIIKIHQEILLTLLAYLSVILAVKVLVKLIEWQVYISQLPLIMSTPLGGGYIIFAFSAVRCPASDVRRHAWFPLI